MIDLWKKADEIEEAATKLLDSASVRAPREATIQRLAELTKLVNSLNKDLREENQIADDLAWEVEDLPKEVARRLNDFDD